jgi:hypothetical protein
MLFLSSPKYEPYKLLWLENIESSIFVSKAVPIFCFRYISFYLNGFFYFYSDTQKNTNIFPAKTNYKRVLNFIYFATNWNFLFVF